MKYLKIYLFYTYHICLRDVHNVEMKEFTSVTETILRTIYEIMRKVLMVKPFLQTLASYVVLLEVPNSTTNDVEYYNKLGTMGIVAWLIVDF